MSEKQNRTDYEIVKALVSADRYPLTTQSDENKLNIASSISQLDIYEDLDYPYLRGEILMVDQVGFKNLFKIKGTERLELSLKSLSNEVFTKKFIITEIINQAINNNKSEVILLNIIEEHGYFGALNSVSKCYKGTPYNIISSVYKELGKEVDTHYTNDVFINNNNQRQMKYIAPNINRIKVADRIRERVYNENNTPFYTYSSLISDKVILSDLYELLNIKEYNKNPYTYSQTQHNEESNPYFHIKSYDIENPPSTFNLFMSGTLKSDLNVFDITTGGHFNYKHNLKETIDNIYIDKEINNEDYLFDYDMKINDGATNGVNDSQTLEDISSHQHSIVVAGSPYMENGGSYFGYHEEFNQDNKHLGKLSSRSIKALMDENTYTITISGAPLLTTSLPSIVGMSIFIEYYRIVGENSKIVLDDNMSGKFLIYRAKHIMSGEDYSIVMDIVKLINDKENYTKI